MPRSAAAAARSIIREKPGAVSGAARSDTNRNGELLLSRRCCRSARNSRPVRGWLLGVPALTLRTLRIAVLKSTCSAARRPPVGEEYTQGIAVTVPVALGRFDQPLDLVRGEMLARSQIGIFRSARGDCSILVAGATTRRCEFVIILSPVN
jgi:hypothetical protein